MMADDMLKVRIEERLKIKIGEAKNLPSRNHGAPSHRDTYCVLALDQEEIFRTSTMERTLDPFFGEEFQFDIPRKFRFLSIYVFDRDKHPKRDRVVGKVAIKREDLHLYNNKDHWFALRPVDADSEVQGEAHIEITLEDTRKRPAEPPPGQISPDNRRSKKFSEYCRLGIVGRLGTSATEPTLSAIEKDNRSRPPLHIDESRSPAADYSSDPERERRCDHEPIEQPDSIVVQVHECSELSPKDGRCDPYARVTVLYADGSVIDSRTSTSRGTVEPQFKERLKFPIHSESGFTAAEILVSLWHDGAPSAFLGEIRLQPTISKAWYFLSSRRSSQRSRGATPPGTRLSASGYAAQLGSIRLLMHYTVDHVFHISEYFRLEQLFLSSVNVEPITSSAVYVLGEIVSSKMDAAQPLVRLFAHHNHIVPIVGALADSEISQLTDATTIFRGNTLVSKMMDEAMRLWGGEYLRSVLRPTLNAVLSERRPCEVDAARAKDVSHLPNNLNNLKDYVERVFSAITSSAAACPRAMCALFETLRLSAVRHFPNNQEVKYSVVSGFIFLRFFAPAILGPRLFNLTDQHIDPQTNRTLTLISKTIQSLGNLVSSRSAQQVCKEEYMAELYKSFCTQKHIQAIKQFLEIISNSSDNPSNSLQEIPVILKEGSMIKRSELSSTCSRRRWTRSQSQKRHFRLTSEELSWSRCGKGPWRSLSISGITRVSDVHAHTATLNDLNLFQIVHRERTLYIQAANCVERAEWVRALRSACPGAREHAGQFARVWSCCGAATPDATGCTADCARDLQRLHALLLSHAKDLDARLRTLTAAYSTKSSLEMCREIETVKSLQEVTFTLEHRHRVYQRSLARQTKYGSKQAPIGEDNYLQLTSTGAYRPGFTTIVPADISNMDYSKHLQNISGVGQTIHRNTEERLSGKSGKAGAGSGGYLVMSCLKNEPSSSDSDDKAHSEYIDVRCKEYELMSEFSSRATSASAESAPPAVPPRAAPPPSPPPPPPHRSTESGPSRPLGERFTPSFLKKKTKTSEELSALHLSNAKLKLPKKSPSADSVELKTERSRSIDSSIVANLKFLSLHRFGDDARGTSLDAGDVRSTESEYGRLFDYTGTTATP